VVCAVSGTDNPVNNAAGISRNLVHLSIVASGDVALGLYDRVAAVACRSLGMLDVQAQAKDCCAIALLMVYHTRSPAPPLATFLL